MKNNFTLFAKMGVLTIGVIVLNIVALLAVVAGALWLLQEFGVL
jgi:hypothetical protein